MTPLESLGPRICIIGPSNAGKSTLADLIAQKIGATPVHLDQLAHYPESHWQRRPDQEFIDLHGKEIIQESWVIEGNYSICMPERFNRASAVIWLDPPLIGCTWRYIWRSFFAKPGRIGGLAGARHEFSWELVKFTWTKYPKNKLKYKQLLKNFDKPLLVIPSMQLLNRYTSFWGLKESV